METPVSAGILSRFEAGLDRCRESAGATVDALLTWWVSGRFDRHKRGHAMTETGDHRLSARDKTTAGILLAIPCLALLLVPIYARSGPHLLGFPFFYWYQFLWVFLAAGFTHAAYVVIQRARHEGDVA